MKHLLSVNNHPVHLSNTKRSQTALIPFCAFGEDMEKMGTHIDGIDVPVCNSFIPKNHDKQLCYEVDLNRYRNISNLEKQLRSGLVLLLDFNEMRQLDESPSIEMHKNMFSEDEENSFTIYLDTISRIAFRLQQELKYSQCVSVVRRSPPNSVRSKFLCNQHLNC